MLVRHLATLAATLSLAAASAAQVKAVRPPSIPHRLASPAVAAIQAIKPENIETHVRFLSHDLLEGRGTGQRGGDLAAEYIATQFALYGLKPAGDKATYMQKVPMVGITPGADTRFTLVPAKGKPVDLKPLDEYVAYDQTQQPASDIDAEIVYVGYGIEAPEYNWDDYKDVDVKGKVLLMLVNQPTDDPKLFHGKALTYYGRWTYKYEEAARRGALGVLIIHRTDLASYGWQVVQNSQAIEKSYLAGDPLNALRAAAWIQHDVAQHLFTQAGLGDLDQAIDRAGKRGFHPQQLSITLKAHIESRVRRYTSTNVVGRVPGASSDPVNSVLYTAHYDHLGIDPDAKGDGIYNGAADNGTGCGILLELARAFAQSTERPPHSVYFAAVTAEEQGLLGSQYLGEHPPIPARDFSLDLNYDMLLPIGIPLSATVGGAERINFWPTVQTVAKDFDLKLEPDSEPMAGHYYRSDHFSLARAGIPAFSIDPGDLYEGHDEAWGKTQSDDFTAHHYHQPSDEFQESWDFRGNAKMARFGFVLGWLAGAQSKPIQWNPGDEFERPRKATEKQ
jgi:Zn-dependent M28 family amino/carboxypeptidase